MVPSLGARIASGTIAAIALSLALFVGFIPIRPAPAIGSFLDPANGLWAAARRAEFPATDKRRIPGLGAEVDVRYDDRGVPHIFATTELDAYRTLGWIHARDRLFQMELTQRAVAGTLTELVGANPTVLELDRKARQQGLARAADAKWAALAPESPTRKAIEAYMEGVNAWVAQMRPADLPVEYRLLSRKPRTFEGRDTYYLLARMALTLAWQDDELQAQAISALVGPDAMRALFPVHASIQEPIQPVRGRNGPRLAFSALPAPRVPDAARVAEAKAWRAMDPLGTGAPITDIAGDLVIGSNNWAVAPSRTANGHALLAGDPHLQLTLPSIWYEAHMVVPGALDVYGVTLPLAPIVPIGFNRDVAWTATNTGADVMDFYRETVDDTIAPAKYLVDGAWRELSVHVEEFRAQNGRVIRTDTMRSTHRGPLLKSPVGYVSMRWTALELSDEGGALQSAARATSAAEWYRAMEAYRAPTQNFLVADRDGHIGIRSNGRYPVRPGDGRGDHVWDGSDGANDWIGDRPISEWPQSMDPVQGYLASANQQPIDPSADPTYMGWNWPAPWRALRINGILREEARMTADKMRRTQTDARSELTPHIVGAIEQAMREARTTRAADDELEAAWKVLSGWDQRFDTTSSGALLYERLLSVLTRRTWDEFVPAGETRRIATPTSMMLVQLLAEPTSPWWDDRSTTDVREDRRQIALASLREAWVTTRTNAGNDPTRWKWGGHRKMNIRHLLFIPGFGREGLPAQSGPGTLSPSDENGTHGASWRFVVELGPELEAYGTYPGGQSGNVASRRYDDRLVQWRKGELSALRFPRTPADLPEKAVMSRLTIIPGASR